MFETADEQLVSGRSQRSTGKRQKTVTRTFRIRTAWDELLRDEAEKQGVSVNVLVNLIFRRYALFDRWVRGYNAITLNQQVFRELIDRLSEEKLVSAGEKSGPVDVQNTLDIMGLPSSYDSFTYLVSKHLGGSDCAMWFTCCHHSQDNSDVFHLQHNFGRGWSIFLQSYFLSYLKNLKVNCETKIYDFAVNLKVNRPR
ncbi:MAG: hypothetical protein NWE94_09955 [Candidatus Bathyarchaeota archaeon]|nr:hypothetical protein [Candidatus Bathyarchaeota archaeon]